MRKITHDQAAYGVRYAIDTLGCVPAGIYLHPPTEHSLLG